VDPVGSNSERQQPLQGKMKPAARWQEEAGPTRRQLQLENRSSREDCQRTKSKIDTKLRSEKIDGKKGLVDARSAGCGGSIRDRHNKN
jgi:hypothetical protein